ARGHDPEAEHVDAAREELRARGIALEVSELAQLGELGVELRAIGVRGDETAEARELSHDAPRRARGLAQQTNRALGAACRRLRRRVHDPLILSRASRVSCLVCS